jgi:hypothetical protein
MKIGLAILVALCVSCASSTPRSAATPEANPAAAAPSSDAQPSVIITTDPHAVMGCRLITKTTAGYDIREPDQWRKLQDETARLGGNAALVSIKGDRKADIFSCTKP